MLAAAAAVLLLEQAEQAGQAAAAMCKPLAQQIQAAAVAVHMEMQITLAQAAQAS
jgi:hypothetical protein